MAYWIIPTDKHVYELPDLWAGGIEPQFRDRASEVVHLQEENDWLVEFCKPFPSRSKGIAMLNIGGDYDYLLSS